MEMTLTLAVLATLAGLTGMGIAVLREVYPLLPFWSAYLLVCVVALVAVGF